MASLPVISGSEVVKVFQRFGWTVARQASSHIIMTKEGVIASLSVPNHREVARGTLSKSYSLGKSNGGRVCSKTKIARP